ncbi:hypothetical protein PHMEG_00023448 [Phytophthora megakarya]|uniref:BED-type domain-containing protein n=1 Tax=Phytophthora megakarya TaxID=4795 RepID=A0A225VJB9_9STRA|nr:hypothetical protein PHMEG_00023448 [Phytophthora megakarya]
MPSIPPRSLTAALFVADDGDYFQCRLCFSRRKQARGTGYLNLLEHLVRRHGETDEDGSLDVFVKTNDFSLTMYPWLAWTIMENRELSMCEKNKTRKYTSVKPVSVKYLKTRINRVEKLVRDRIQSQLSGKQAGFGFDAWTEDGTHFIDIIA